MVRMGIKELLEHYDGFILRHHGLLHDGEVAYPGVVECLQRFSDAGKPCVILSNFAGRAAAQRMHLPDLGTNASHVVGIVTSGELARSYLGRRQDKLGNRVLWISSAPGEDERLDDYFADLGGYTLTADVEEADFLFASGVAALFAGTEEEKPTESDRDGNLKPFTKTFRRAINRGLLMLCANPDSVQAGAAGSCVHLPGLITQYFEKLGGRVLYFGTPYTAAFEEARRLLDEVLGPMGGGTPAPVKVLCSGTDVELLAVKTEPCPSSS